MATLTYVYADQTAVLGPLATYAEPHCYDLCSHHSERMTAPRGWEVVGDDATYVVRLDEAVEQIGVQHGSDPTQRGGVPMPVGA